MGGEGGKVLEGAGKKEKGRPELGAPVSFGRSP